MLQKTFLLVSEVLLSKVPTALSCLSTVNSGMPMSWPNEVHCMASTIERATCGRSHPNRTTTLSTAYVPQVQLKVLGFDH
ncbi:hypothetical protein FA15DRAFT_246524 [Coprinopsis marcescibilis]|uniref:Secreted protein n=1 Tax=Coprinopsis marcescibilis TaxID=230819 RepID=A0A5C3L357_COPMA|nr:hypothetical protein FA15DRAFT_246524 [Coprinopsis marcescibilis]